MQGLTIFKSEHTGFMEVNECPRVAAVRGHGEVWSVWAANGSIVKVGSEQEAIELMLKTARSFC